MNTKFIELFIPGAVAANIIQENGIHCYSYEGGLFVLIDAKIFGLLTEEIKKELTERLNLMSFPTFVNIFKSRKEMKKSGDIALGTYVWFSDEPEHFIHFDNKPSGKKLILHKATTQV